MASELTNAYQPESGENALFRLTEGGEDLKVRVEDDDFWLTQSQISQLFQVHASTVSEHLRNIYAAGELDKDATSRQIRLIRQEGARTVARPLNHYNLDAILSVGYRVSSKRGAQFRRWATDRLKERLEADADQRRKVELGGIAEITGAIRLAKEALANQTPDIEAAAGVLQIIERYATAFTLLLQYDEGRLPDPPAAPSENMASLPLDDARACIRQLKASLRERGEDTDLLGQERGEGLAGILEQIEQTVFGEPAYPSIELRAVNLLYFIIKNHPFSDGNKRIGSFLFVEYLRRNNRLTRADGSPQIDDNALVALALLIAESDPAQREMILRLALGLLETRGAAERPAAQAAA